MPVGQPDGFELRRFDAQTAAHQAGEHGRKSGSAPVITTSPARQGASQFIADAGRPVAGKLSERWGQKDSAQAAANLSDPIFLTAVLLNWPQPGPLHAVQHRQFR
jgi:hypothetical protein